MPLLDTTSAILFYVYHNLQNIFFLNRNGPQCAPRWAALPQLVMGYRWASKDMALAFLFIPPTMLLNPLIFPNCYISFSPASLIQCVELGSCKILHCSHGNVNNFSKTAVEEKKNRVNEGKQMSSQYPIISCF